ncbi:MAG: LPS export ABC transporter periplasmic protein LptC [Victivallales bacterium]
MGRVDAKIYLIILVLSGISPFSYNAVAGNGETSVILYDFKLPEYNKDTGELDCIIYGQKAQTMDVRIELEQLKVEWVGKDQNDIKGAVTTTKGVYDRSSKIIQGDEEVHFRSAGMDVDGVGFDADQKRETIHIRSKVKVILRGTLETDREKAEKITQENEKTKGKK